MLCPSPNLALSWHFPGPSPCLSLAPSLALALNLTKIYLLHELAMPYPSPAMP
jgi:hypothetical protein